VASEAPSTERDGNRWALLDTTAPTLDPTVDHAAVPGEYGVRLDEDERRRQPLHACDSHAPSIRSAVVRRSRGRRARFRTAN
jgi:hypothetical protein